eukprot:TRINITY_DN4796_c0_g4_i3.p1 TRINITY_DN4796_c0_g4~~TRINITY_DN4796_c0_g4_i3.p1  ORF type:complete len:117 (-),score=15.24 TRINITY_DN4796_c0_g4_i3:108-458(-)
METSVALKRYLFFSGKLGWAVVKYNNDNKHAPFFIQIQTKIYIFNAKTKKKKKMVILERDEEDNEEKKENKNDKMKKAFHKQRGGVVVVLSIVRFVNLSIRLPAKIGTEKLLFPPF